MNSDPWMTYQLALGRLEDLRRTAEVRRLVASSPRVRRTTALSAFVGTLLIRAGRRMAGPDAVAAKSAGAAPSGARGRELRPL